jgi:1-acyl-sn-glycerol-3-phosphate acyltransferase
MLTTLRSAFYYILLPTSAILWGTICCWSLFKKDWALTVSQIWARFAIASLKVICGTDHSLKGLSGDAPQAIYAVKHQAMWETIALATILPRPCFVLKKELIRIPVFGWWCAASGHISVDRHAGAAAMKQMLATAKQRVAEGRSIVIFPEGTRVAPGKTGEYHPGVAGLYGVLGLPCIPVAHNSGLYWKHPGITRERGTIHVEFGTAIEPGMKRGPFMKQLQATIDNTSNQLVAQALNANEGRAETSPSNLASDT